MVTEKTHKITLHNDDNNSFEYIMSCLVRLCNHTPLQAEQCALIADATGKVDIMSGTFDHMYDILNTFSELNVEASIEQLKNESNLY
jgi:ATP-dependent Clp protease adaptor protein ClpS